MSIDIKVVCPSYKRAGSVKTVSVVSNLAIVVRPAEKDEYAKFYPNNEIIPLPDTVIGLANTRQWIYENYPNVFMLDDDIVACSKMYHVTKKKTFMKTTPDEAYELIQYAGNMAHLAGCYLFGFNRSPNPLLFSPFNPILLSGFINGCAFGMLEGSKLHFDQRFTAVEDFYVSGVNAYYHRMAWIDMRFNFQQVGTFMLQGGQSSYRTMDTEKNDTLLLRKTFGECIELKPEKFGGKSMTTGSKNPYGRTMKIPF